MAAEKTPRRAGGQAVIEGVMMRAPGATSIAVRTPDKGITVLVKPSISIMDRVKLLSKPFIRGGIILMETMFDGVGALKYSADRASGDDKSVQFLAGKAAITGTMVISVLIGLGIFVVLPHALTWGIGKLSSNTILESGSSAIFQLIEGGFKVIILLIYLELILMMKDVKRVFQYHGAEHQAVHTFESDMEILPENMETFTTAHPRCGTSLIFVVILVSVLVFAAVFPFLPKISNSNIVNNLAIILGKLLLIFPIAAISYEVIRFAFNHMDTWVGRILSAPGKWLQIHFTTRRPDKDQQEVGAAALRAALFCGECKNCHEQEASFTDFNDFLSHFKDVLGTERKTTTE